MRRFRIKIEEKVYEVEVEEIREEVQRNSSKKQIANLPPSLPSHMQSILYAPMAGKILDIKKEEGDACEAGEIIFVMESMKMEVYVRSQLKGTIKKIFVARNNIVEANTPLAEVGG